jgi:hypothetical protein
MAMYEVFPIKKAVEAKSKKKDISYLSSDDVTSASKKMQSAAKSGVDGLLAAKKEVMDVQRSMADTAGAAKSQVSEAIEPAKSMVDSAITQVNSATAATNEALNNALNSQMMQDMAAGLEDFCDFDMSGYSLDMGFPDYLNALNMSLKIGNVPLYDALINCANMIGDKVSSVCSVVQGGLGDLANNGQIKEYAAVAESIGLDGVTDKVSHIQKLAKSASSDDDVSKLKTIMSSFGDSESSLIKTDLFPEKDDITVFDVDMVKSFTGKSKGIINKTVPDAHIDTISQLF